MNRLVCTNMDVVRPEMLPPVKWEAAARVLFVHGYELGFGTTGRNLEHYAAERADIDAVHLWIKMPLWLRAACKELPKSLGGWDFHNTRMTMAWEREVGRLLGRVFPLERFDVVHIMTRERAGIVRRLVKAAGPRPRFVVNVDATLAAWDRDFEIWRPAPKVDHRTDASVLLSADAVAFASRWAMDSAVKDYGVDAAKCFLHRPCARVSPPHQLSPLAGPTAKIVFVGNDWERKGGPRLLKWHQERWAARAELHVCSGAAPKDPTAQNVAWHGAVPHDRLMNEILPAMHLMVIPTWEDTFLIAAQEAQAVGLPVVSSKLAAIPEVVLDGKTGILCKRADDAGFIAAVESLLGDALKWGVMSSAARKHAAKDLNADVWHNHLLDQIVSLADGKAVVCEPKH